MISSQAISSRRAWSPYLHPRAARSGKSGKSCVFGCFTGFLLAVALMVGVVFFAGYQIKKFTQTTPVELPAPALSKEEAQPVLNRAHSFAYALAQGEDTPPLELSADELNALLTYEPAYKGAGEHVNLRVEGDTVGGRMSLPLGELAPSLPMLENRYFNGDVSATVNYENGLLEVYIKSLEVEGEPLPDQVLQQLTSENVAEEAMKKAQIRQILDPLESIKVENGRLIITPKPASERAPQ